jgi:hypothetical protein
MISAKTDDNFHYRMRQWQTPAGFSSSMFLFAFGQNRGRREKRAEPQSRTVSTRGITHTGPRQRLHSERGSVSEPEAEKNHL